MANEVELKVRTQLQKVISDLEGIKGAAQDVHDQMAKMGQGVEDNIKQNEKKTKTFLENIRGLGGRVAGQLKSDFKALMSMNAIKDSLALSSQFRGSLKETMNLGDAIRKLGSTFGIAGRDFASFQSKLTKGLGDIGMSSEVAAKVMEGLADTPVRGEKSLLKYSQTAGKLASISRQQGKEGDIAKGIAEVIRAKGGDVNDTGAMEAVAEDLRRVFVQTGKGPTETLGAMQQIFEGMSQDFRKTFSTRGLAMLAAGGQVAGPNSVKFLEEYLSKSPIARASMDAQGFKGVFTDNGIDIDKFKTASAGVLNRVGGDPRLAAQTLGLSEEAAEGFVRMAESLDLVKTAQEAVKASSGSLDEQYRKSMGFTESFKANINRLKGALSEPLAFLSQKGSDLMSAASESDAGAAGVVAGGATLAAILAGFGTRGLGKALGGGVGGLLKGGAATALTGQEVQPVYVVNASEIGGGLGGAGGGAAGLAKGAAGVLVAGAAGYAVGTAANSLIESHTQGTTSEGFEGNAVERMFFKLDKALDGKLSGQPNMHKPQKVIVELNKRDLKETKQPSRGGSN